MAQASEAAPQAARHPLLRTVELGDKRLKAAGWRLGFTLFGFAFAWVPGQSGLLHGPGWLAPVLGVLGGWLLHLLATDPRIRKQPDLEHAEDGFRIYLQVVQPVWFILICGFVVHQTAIATAYWGFPTLREERLAYVMKSWRISDGDDDSPDYDTRARVAMADGIYLYTSPTDRDPVLIPDRCIVLSVKVGRYGVTRAISARPIRPGDPRSCAIK